MLRVWLSAIFSNAQSLVWLWCAKPLKALTANAGDLPVNTNIKIQTKWNYQCSISQNIMPTHIPSYKVKLLQQSIQLVNTCIKIKSEIFKSVTTNTACQCIWQSTKLNYQGNDNQYSRLACQDMVEMKIKVLFKSHLMPTNEREIWIMKNIHLVEFML